METNNLYKGKYLIADPSLQDLFFKKSVIMMIEHDEEGAFGLILNKPINIKVNDYIKGFPELHDFKLFMGGPVKTDNIFMIHDLGQKIQGSEEIAKNIFWGGNIENVIELVLNHEISMQNIKFFLGYSGWDPKQIEDEIKEKSWIVSTAKSKELFALQPNQMWSNLMRKMGNEYAIWSNMPVNPAYN